MTVAVYVLLGVFVAITALLVLLSTFSICWMLGTWNTADAIRRRAAPAEVDPPIHRFSLIVPARNEVPVLDRTLEKMMQIDHPDFEVVVVVGHDDPETAAVAVEAAQRHPGRIVVAVDRHRDKNKPKALNVGLAAAHHEIVGVFDAEDEVAGGLLRLVDHVLRDDSVHIVQGGVQLMNFRSRWFAVRNVLEYFFHFGSRLHLHARRGLIPLGGNTVFFRRELLEAAEGWDEDCLAEDCEIGIRLSAAGARTVVVYDPELSTREEAPVDLASFMRQRVRWDHGFLQVLRKGEWRRLPRRSQRLSAWFVLANPFLQAVGTAAAIFQIVIALTVDVPLAITMLAFLPFILTTVIVSVEVVGLWEFCRVYGEKARWRDYVFAAVGYLPYHFLLSAAAVRAVVRARRGDISWAKTRHVGAHRPVHLPNLTLSRVGPDVIDLREPVSVVDVTDDAEEVEGVA
jgi:cellulose synthase/poly-beta-1,6-N-acetylglucosamine synthase-like glycosyltransferase